MNVLVVGGSGFIGHEVSRQLVAAGHRPRVLSRGTRSAVPDAETAVGTVLDSTGLEAACDGCDAVIYLAGIIAEVGVQTYRAIHAEGTGRMLAAARARGVRRWIQMSALGSRPEAPARYHRSKWEGEEAVRRSGFDWTLLRPSLVYGPGDGFVNRFERISRWSPVVPLIGGGTMPLQPIAVADVARCCVAAIGGAGAGRTIELCGRERVTLRELVAAILDATGRKRFLMPVPWGVARVVATVLEGVFPALFRAAPPLNRDQLTMLAEGSVGDPAPMVREFGFEPTPFSEGVRVMFARG